MAIRRAHVIVRGRVQGVSFRVLTCDRARTRGVLGWVRNRVDGSVEAVFEGNETDVARLVEWCRHGPPGAFVQSVDVSWEDPEGERDFRIS
jgi:acylphosphatase